MSPDATKRPRGQKSPLPRIIGLQHSSIQKPEKEINLQGGLLQLNHILLKWIYHYFKLVTNLVSSMTNP